MGFSPNVHMDTFTNIYGGEVARWERCEKGKVRKVGGSWFIQGRGCRVSSRLYVFVSDANQGNKGAGWVEDLLVWPQGWKESP